MFTNWSKLSEEVCRKTTDVKMHSNEFWLKNFFATDLGSLNGTISQSLESQCENQDMVYWNSQKMSIFSNFRGSESWFWWICAIVRGWNFPKSKFRASETVKMAIFGPQNLPKLISHKIWMARKCLKFHIVRVSFRLPKSVLLGKYWLAAVASISFEIKAAMYVEAFGL